MSLSRSYQETNPRGQGILVSIEGKFITRRGIPYGNPDSDDKKGLLFMCFQSNLRRQFTFIQRAWSNAPAFPPFRGKPGVDPMIGQGHAGGQSWPVQYGSEHTTDFNFAGIIKMKGGEYFFHGERCVDGIETWYRLLVTVIVP